MAEQECLPELTWKVVPIRGVRGGVAVGGGGTLAYVEMFGALSSLSCWFRSTPASVHMNFEAPPHSGGTIKHVLMHLHLRVKEIQA